VASVQEIAEVRYNTNEPNDAEPFTDVVVSDLIDAGGVNSASAVIWRRKAASASDYVDVTEAGSSHKFSDLQDNYLEMAKLFDEADAGSPEAEAEIRAKVKIIDRT